MREGGRGEIEVVRIYEANEERDTCIRCREWRGWADHEKDGYMKKEG